MASYVALFANLGLSESARHLRTRITSLERDRAASTHWRPINPKPRNVPLPQGAMRALITNNLDTTQIDSDEVLARDTQRDQAVKRRSEGRLTCSQATELK
jgi:hypothetical protein